MKLELMASCIFSYETEEDQCPVQLLTDRSMLHLASTGVTCRCSIFCAFNGRLMHSGSFCPPSFKDVFIMNLISSEDLV